MTTNPTEADRVSLLETMLLISTYEQRLAALNAGGAPGTCTAIGQEAVAAGVMRALTANDRILTNHRSTGHLLARGANPGRLMAGVIDLRTLKPLDTETVLSSNRRTGRLVVVREAAAPFGSC